MLVSRLKNLAEAVVRYSMAFLYLDLHLIGWRAGVGSLFLRALVYVLRVIGRSIGNLKGLNLRRIRGFDSHGLLLLFLTRRAIALNHLAEPLYIFRTK